MAFEKRYTAKQVAQAVLETTRDLLAKSELAKSEKMRKDGQTLGAAIGYPGAAQTAPAPAPSPVAKGESKHDRCVEHVKENSPDVKNPHAVCVAEGVKPESWSKSEVEQYFQKSEREAACISKHGLSSEQIKAKLQKDGLSPAQIRAKLQKNGVSADVIADRLAKYESTMSDKLGYKPSELGAKEVDQEKTDKDYKVHPDAPANALGPKSPASNTGVPEVQKSESDRLRDQTNPLTNPKEQAEGNNELAGTTPTQVGQDGKNKPGFDEMRGHLKLAKFIGHMEAMRKVRKGPSNG